MPTVSFLKPFIPDPAAAATTLRLSSTHNKHRQYEVVLDNGVIPLIGGGEGMAICKARVVRISHDGKTTDFGEKPVVLKILTIDPAKVSSQDRDVHYFLMDNEYSKLRQLNSPEPHLESRPKFHPGIVKALAFETDKNYGPPLLEKSEDGQVYLRFMPMPRISRRDYKKTHGYEGLPFLVIEYVEGPTLQRVMHLMHEQGRRLSIYSILEILIQVLEAASHAHQQNILHGDIKPSNVLLMRDPNLPGGWRTKLADWGTAANTRTDTALWIRGCSYDFDAYQAGTQTFMAPEQLVKAVKVSGEDGETKIQQTPGIMTTASDLFAIGAMAYTLLTWGPFPRNQIGNLPPMNLPTTIPEPARKILEQDVRAMTDPAFSKRPLASKIASKWRGLLKHFIKPDGSEHVELDDDELEIAVENETEPNVNAALPNKVTVSIAWIREHLKWNSLTWLRGYIGTRLKNLRQRISSSGSHRRI